ncbi:hypothetical protein PM082_007132 [Marasmius tenuissimus]|nr:hypothetical protein PM082_007132 [Marasmius tenuissimus]
MGRIPFLTVFALVLFFSCCAGANGEHFLPRPAPPTGRKAPPGRVFKRSTGEEIPPYNTVYYFDQLVDHNDPSLGTFKQRYWHTAEFYEPAGPIILNTPGENNAERYTFYLTNQTITGYMAQIFNGATVILEHRFFGLSNPVEDLKGTTLAKYHTIDQAVGDLEYFAGNVKLPMDSGGEVAPGKAPWILTGGSYPGALTAWTMYKKPGLFHAGWSSSGPVQPIYNFWRYYEPIREHMPKNCSADVEAVIALVDKTIDSNDAIEIQELKANFGMSNVTNIDDFAATLTTPFYKWQDITPDSGPMTEFGEFCDALEVDETGQHAPEQGWGVEKALASWGSYFTETFLQRRCRGQRSIAECLNTQPANATVDLGSINTTIDNASQSWMWFVCNEVGWHQVGAPAGEKTPRLVSRYHTTEYMSKFCKLQFPDAPTGGEKALDRTIATYGGWNVTVDRMVSVVGGRDPWREATLGASSLNRTSTERMPTVFAAGGTHCADMIMDYGMLDSTIGVAVSEGLGYMQKWIEEWEPDPDPSNKDLKGSDPAKSTNGYDGGLHLLKGWQYRVALYLGTSVASWIMLGECL